MDIARTAVSTLRSLIGRQSGAMPDVQYRPRLRGRRLDRRPVGRQLSETALGSGFGPVEPR